MTKHTPGPWEAVIQHGCYAVIVSIEGEAKVVAIVGNNNPDDGKEPMRFANARLIAAAPDLLETLKAFSDYVHQEQSSTDGAVTYSTTAINHWAFLARAAIAKATGEAALKKKKNI